MKRIGLTGGIATGKSTVARILRNRFSAPVVDADQVARDIVAPGQPALQEIATHFGEAVLHPDGSLNRAALGQRVMSNAQERSTLNQITHPRIFEAIREQLETFERKGALAAVVEAALMVETGSYKAYDGLIVVNCTREHQMARLMNRNQLSKTDAQKWIDAQMPLSDKRSVADWVIENDGSQESLYESVLAVWREVLNSD